MRAPFGAQTGERLTIGREVADQLLHGVADLLFAAVGFRADVRSIITAVAHRGEWELSGTLRISNRSRHFLTTQRSFATMPRPPVVRSLATATIVGIPAQDMGAMASAATRRSGGAGEIRTRERGTPVTAFPVPRPRPD